MARLDLVQAQNYLRQKSNEPARKLRRQATGAALFLLLGGGYALYHAVSAKLALETTPVTFPTLKPKTVSPFAEFSGRINALDDVETRPQVAGRITEIRFKDGQEVQAGDVLHHHV